MCLHLAAHNRANRNHYKPVGLRSNVGKEHVPVMMHYRIEAPTEFQEYSHLSGGVCPIVEALLEWAKGQMYQRVIGQARAQHHCCQYVCRDRYALQAEHIVKPLATPGVTVRLIPR